MKSWFTGTPKHQCTTNKHTSARNDHTSEIYARSWLYAYVAGPSKQIKSFSYPYFE